jgi:hypothetical protein
MKIIKKFDKEIINKLDQRTIKIMRRTSRIAIRHLAIFIWFGILKPLHLSPEGLLKATVVWLPFGSPDHWLIIIGWWKLLWYLFEKNNKISKYFY